MAVTVRNPAELTLERYFELVRQYPGKKFTFNSRGEIIEMAPVRAHGFLQVDIAWLLKNWLLTGSLPGFRTGVEILHNLDGWICQPDVVICREEGPPVAQEAPLLAVEVHSRSNTRSELEAKAARYLQKGTQMVWLLYPQTASLVLHVADGPPRTLRGDDLIEGGEVLPGFRVPVSDIFSETS
ncbi:MAG: Uma2 family endonuclease [Anaerolineaceae bacterium]|nr:Uma2 family endonuclease [Anaerolineaceae bacterium]MDE0330156.1 Uma2 family endonuclease [Anaerolineaceae bacterium]